MEHPTPGTNAYAEGIPLVRIEPATEEDRGWVEGQRRAAKADLRHWTEAGMASGFLAAIPATLAVFGGFERLAICAAILLAPWIVVVVKKRVLSGLVDPEERWVFEGRRVARPVRRVLLWSPRRRLPAKNLIVLMPGGNIASADGAKARRLRRVKPRVVAQPGAVGERGLTDSERQEFDNLIKETRETASAKALVVFFLSAKAVIELGPLWFPLIAAGALALLELARVGPGRFRFLSRNRMPNRRIVRTISIRSPAFAAALDEHTDPDLDAAMRQIEVLESGLLWTVDDRPAAWRIYGTTPVFVPKSILALPAGAPALSARHASEGREP